jgi:5'-3' exonuclease
MGIRHLNRYLLKNCGKQAIHKINLSEIKNKTIVVDTSILIYKYLEENKLFENFQKLITILESYKIKAIFVFDGKAPLEKKQLLEERQEKKREAKRKYEELILTSEEYKGIAYEKEINNLRKQFIRVCDDDLDKLKVLMKDNNVDMVVADGEADELCARFVKSNSCWGVLSDDMDFFVYGCNRILRELSLQDNTVMLYILPEILYDLKMPLKSFRDILVISGTDYNLIDKNENINLYETLKWYKWYRVYNTKHRTTYQHKLPMSFYEWLLANTKYVKNYDNLLKISRIFNIDNSLPT